MASAYRQALRRARSCILGAVFAIVLPGIALGTLVQSSYRWARPSAPGKAEKAGLAVLWMWTCAVVGYASYQSYSADTVPALADPVCIELHYEVFSAFKAVVLGCRIVIVAGLIRLHKLAGACLVACCAAPTTTAVWGISAAIAYNWPDELGGG